MNAGEEAERQLKEAKEQFHFATQAQAEGRMVDARQGMLRAAEALLKAAAVSSEPLASNRKRLAQQILDQTGQMTDVQPSSFPATLSPAKAKQPLAATTLGNDEQAKSWLVQERPDVRFEDIAGLEGVKEQIRLKLLYPFTHPELAAQYGIKPGGGILLYGPPGTGKTLIARAIAGEIQAAFFSITPSEIMSQWVGIAEQNINRLFAEAETYPLSVLFVDEMEALAPKRRTSGSTVMVRVVPQLLTELDGFSKRTNPLLLVGATNEPWTIDPAILRPGRLDRLIYVPPPDLTARQKILELNLSQTMLQDDVDLEEVAHHTESFSGADMASLAQRVREQVFSEVVQSGQPRPLRMTDFESVLSNMTPSIRPADLELYERFAAGKSTSR